MRGIKEQYSFGGLRAETVITASTLLYRNLGQSGEVPPGEVDSAPSTWQAGAKSVSAASKLPHENVAPDELPVGIEYIWQDA
jgi:hypothetical protein